MTYKEIIEICKDIIAIAEIMEETTQKAKLNDLYQDMELNRDILIRLINEL